MNNINKIIYIIKKYKYNKNYYYKIILIFDYNILI